MKKFLRNYRLKAEIGTLKGGVKHISEEIVISYPLTINFSITRSEFAQASTASFEIINLKEATRAKLYKDRQDTEKYILIKFYAGYGEDEKKLPMCFCGDVLDCYSYKDGGTTEFKTEITTMSGGINRTEFSSNFEMTAGTPPLLIIQKLANDMHVEIGAISSTILDKLTKSSRAVPFSGNSYEILSNYVGGHMFIDNNRLYILDKDDVRLDGVLTLNVDTGLVGTPKRRDAVLEASLVFEPNIELCQLLYLTSLTAPYMNGQYKVIGFSHNGTISGTIGGQCISSVYLDAKQIFRPVVTL